MNFDLVLETPRDVPTLGPGVGEVLQFGGVWYVADNDIPNFRRKRGSGIRSAYGCHCVVERREEGAMDD